MGDQVVWPTRDELYVFDQAVDRGAEDRRAIRFRWAKARQAAGGNLVAAGELLLIATPDKLFAFRQQGGRARRQVTPAQRPPAACPPPERPMSY